VFLPSTRDGTREQAVSLVFYATGLARSTSLLGVIGERSILMRTLQDTLPIRSFLLSEVLYFVHRARTCAGVERIALVGSLTTGKRDPKDADVLVTVDNAADLGALAAAGRRLKGRAQSRNKGADIFLADRSGKYLGRTCHWRECAPGIRKSCDARHCGVRPFLHDDLDAVTLDAALVKSPPIVLWPHVIRSVPVPDDVERFLLKALEAQVRGQ
jgi:hypothetical protein